MKDAQATLRAFRPGPVFARLFLDLAGNPAAQNAIAGAALRFCLDGTPPPPDTLAPEAWPPLRKELAAAAARAASTSKARAAAGKQSGAARRRLRDLKKGPCLAALESPDTGPALEGSAAPSPPAPASTGRALPRVEGTPAPPPLRPAAPCRASPSPPAALPEMLKAEFRAVPVELLRGSMFRDPVNFAVWICGRGTDFDRRTFGARLREMGRKAFLGVCENFRAELNAGETVRNPAAALSRRLKDWNAPEPDESPPPPSRPLRRGGP